LTKLAARYRLDPNAEQQRQANAEPQSEAWTLPESDTTYLPHDIAAKRIYDAKVAAGEKIGSPFGFMAGVVKNRTAIDEALNSIGRELPGLSERQALSDFFSPFYATNNRTDARKVRDVLTSRLPPQSSAVVHRHLGNDTIAKIWRHESSTR
jgi:hypothetical protein